MLRCKWSAALGKRCAASRHVSNGRLGPFTLVCSFYGSQQKVRTAVVGQHLTDVRFAVRSGLLGH